jgi:hypothetical protein
MGKVEQTECRNGGLLLQSFTQRYLEIILMDTVPDLLVQLGERTCPVLV